MKKFLLLILSILPMCLSAQDLDAGKSLVFVKMQDADNNVLDNNGNPCAKIVVETSIKGMDIVGGYIISEITSTSKGYEFYVSVPKRQGQYITFFHDEFNSLSIPLWIDGALTGGAEYALHINKIANVSMESFYANSGMTSLDLSSLRTSMVINMRQMFSRCGKLTRLDLRNFDTSNVRDMSGMFEKCSEGIEGAFDFPSEYSGLQSLDLSSFNTSNVTDMSRMFSWCSALKSLNVSSFNTANVTDMSEMFAECYVLTTLNLSSFNTSKVTNMHRMFGCFTVAGRQGRIKVLDLSSFKTSNVRDMSEMFDGCVDLTHLDISNFDMSNVRNTENMFQYCDNLKTIMVTNCNDKTINMLKQAIREANLDHPVNLIY